MVRVSVFAFLVFILLLPCKVAAAESSIPTEPITANDIFALEDGMDLFIVESILKHACCISISQLDIFLRRSIINAQLVVDTYEYQLARNSRRGFKERYGEWTPFYSRGFGLGLSLHIETRYITQPRITFRLSGARVPLVTLSPLSRDKIIELRFEF